MRKSTEEKIRSIEGFNYENWVEKGGRLGYILDISFDAPKSDYYIRRHYSIKDIINDMSNRIQKLEEIIKANNYEYKTETTLVKTKKE